MSSDSHRSGRRRELYRDPERAKIAGVCAGLADYFGFETWLVRVAVASACILTGIFGLPLLLYIVAWMMLDKKPAEHAGAEQGASTIEVKSKVWQSGEPPRQAFKDIVVRYDQLEGRLRKLEGYVTSREFTLKRELNKL